MSVQDYRADAMRCCRCSYCKWIPFDQVKSARFAKGCPSVEYNKFQPYSAGGRLSAMLSVMDGRAEVTERFVDIANNCLLCGSCDVACKVCRYNMEPLKAFHEQRAALVEDGYLLPQNIPTIDSLRKEDTMIVGKAKADRGKWAEGLTGVKDLAKERAKVAFHAGCRFSFDEGLWDVPRAAVSLLRDADVDIGIMGKSESCCAGRAYSLGYRGEFTKFAENNLDAWRNAGVETIVTSCSDCRWAFSRLYAEMGSKIEVLHTVEFIDRLIGQGKLTFTKSLPMKVTYHDPCHLGRQGEPYVPWNGKEKKIYGQVVVYEPRKPRYNGAWGVYDPPRNILKSIPGIELVEMERNREYAWCCGAGGGVIDNYPDFAAWTAAERIEEAKATGAEAIVTACGWCERNLGDAVGRDGNGMKVYDIIDLVKQAL